VQQVNEVHSLYLQGARFSGKTDNHSVGKNILDILTNLKIRENSGSHGGEYEVAPLERRSTSN
jgi:hypothetical protein